MLNKKYKVIWAPSAKKDLEDIVLYIAESNPQNAEAVLERLISIAENLILYPEKGAIVPELKNLFIKSYLQVLSSPWRIIYKMSESNVYLIAIIDSRRDLNDILVLRITR